MTHVSLLLLVIMIEVNMILGDFKIVLKSMHTAVKLGIRFFYQHRIILMLLILTRKES
jgi:hypothetical protein